MFRPSPPVHRVGEYQFLVDDSNLLGRGSFASVYRGSHSTTNEVIAIKLIDYASRSPTDKRYINQEIELLKRLDHPNIVKLHYKHEDSFLFHLLTSKTDSRYLYLVMEYCGGGNLKQFLDKQPQKRLPESTARHFMCQLAAGLHFLHDNGIVHRDLKPQNLVLTEASPSAELKIADFGFARMELPEMHSFLGSPLYMSPEILLGRVYTSKSDLWSVGCIFYEMLMGYTPLNHARDMNDLRMRAADHKAAIQYPLPLSPDCRNLLEGLLQRDPDRRLDWPSYLHHAYLRPQQMEMSIVQHSPHEEPVGTNVPVPAEDQTWTQLVQTFFPHGQEIALFIRPVHTVAELKRILGANDSNFLLVDPEGNELENSHTVQHYRLHQTERPLYLLDLAQLKGSPETLPAYTLPEKLRSPEYTPPGPSDSRSSLDTLLRRQIEVELQLTHLRKLQETVKDRFVAVNACYDTAMCQEKVYQAVRQPYTSALVYNINARLQLVTSTYQRLSSNATKLLESADSLKATMKSTKVEQSLLATPDVKKATLMDLVGMNAVDTIFHNLSHHAIETHGTFSALTKRFHQIQTDLDAILSLKLDPRPMSEITESKGSVKGTYKYLTDRIRVFESEVATLQPKVHQLRENTRSPSVEHDAAALLTSSSYVDLSRKWNELLERDNLCFASLNSAAQAKTRLSRALYTVLVDKFLPLKSQVEQLYVDLTNFAPALESLRAAIDETTNITKLPQQYNQALDEVRRRHVYRNRVQKLLATAEDHLKKLRTEETAARTTFHNLVGNNLHPLLSPYLKLHSAEIDAIPLTNMGEIDTHLPPVQLVVLEDVDDDFSFVYVESEGPERLKRLEAEKNQWRQTAEKLQEHLINERTKHTDDIDAALKVLLRGENGLRTRLQELDASAREANQERDQQAKRIRELETQCRALQEMLRNTGQNSAPQTAPNQNPMTQPKQPQSPSPSRPNTTTTQVPPQAVRSPHGDSLEKLVIMGFSRDSAEAALNTHNGDIHAALNRLLNNV